MTGRPTVSVVYRHVPQYRREFYERLRRDLGERGISLELVHGQPVGEDAAKADSVRLPWATEIRNRVVTTAGKQLVWQPAWRHVRGSDLVVVEQASKLPLNLLLLAAQQLGGPRVALWGHGVNLQADSRRLTQLSERVKRRTTLAAHWFFAYTDGVADKVRDLGYPADRITVMQNALDTTTLQRQYRDTCQTEVDELRRTHGIVGSHVGLYLGALYRQKRLDYLIESARRTRELLPDYELIVAGAGPDTDAIDAAARRHSWIHAVGPAFGRQKAVLGRASDVVLLPGLVGLAALDSFALQAPVVTVDLPYHSPEFEYLVDGVNSVILPRDTSPATYGAAVAHLVADRERLELLKHGCRSSADRYTVDEMSARCARGVMQALGRVPV